MQKSKPQPSSSSMKSMPSVGREKINLEELTTKGQIPSINYLLKWMVLALQMILLFLQPPIVKKCLIMLLLGQADLIESLKLNSPI